MDKRFSDIIFKSLNRRYKVIQKSEYSLEYSRIMTINSNEDITPIVTDEFIQNTFDLNSDESYMVNVIWLSQSGFKNIHSNYYVIYTQNTIKSIGNDLWTTTPTITLDGSNNTAIGDYYLALGSNNTAIGDYSMSL